jgi:hypothetical protein
VRGGCDGLESLGVVVKYIQSVDCMAIASPHGREAFCALVAHGWRGIEAFDQEQTSCGRHPTQPRNPNL